MDSSTRNTFFALLRSGLYGTPIAEDELVMPIDWQQIIAVAKKQTVGGVIFDAVSRLPEACQPPKAIKDEMLRQSLRILNSHSMLDSTLAEVVNFYRGKGIEGVLLKGQGIARCYRSPHMRQCGDIDLYIGKKDYARGVELALQSLGTDKEEGAESIKHFHFNMGQVTVELHRLAALMHTPFRKSSFQKWIESELDDKNKLRRVDINGTEVQVPSPTFNAFFIFYHAWYHFYGGGGIGLRQLCDWTMVLHKHKNEIDRKELEECLRRFELSKAWQVFAHIAVEQLGLPAEEMPLYQESRPKRYDTVLERVVDGGNFGFYDPKAPWDAVRYMPLFKRKAHLLGKWWKSFTLTTSLIPLESTFYTIDLFGVAVYNTVKQFIKNGNKSVAETSRKH